MQDETVTNHEISPLPYMTQLDALRALAVFVVMLSHFGLGEMGARWEVGVWGVRQFFVLSGFLITGILLSERERTHTGRERWGVLRHFYMRRALRILPLFYFVLAVATLLNVPEVRAMFWWHFTYISNFYLASRANWPGPSSHLWSLAVEEQFYFIWPWLMLFLPKRFLLPAILAAITGSLLYKVCGVALNWKAMTLLVNPIACLDTLGLGALLALWRYRAPRQFVKVTQFSAYRNIGWVLLALMILPLPLPISLIVNIVQPLFFAWMVHRAAVGFCGKAGRIMQAPLLLACGKMSYGLYIYHNFMPYLVTRALAAVGVGTHLGIAAYALLFIAATFLAAMISWRVLEQPMLRLKNRFAYAT